MLHSILTPFEGEDTGSEKELPSSVSLSESDRTGFGSMGSLSGAVLLSSIQPHFGTIRNNIDKQIIRTPQATFWFTLVCVSVWSSALGNRDKNRSFHKGFCFPLWVYSVWLRYQWEYLLCIFTESFSKRVPAAWLGFGGGRICFISLITHISWARGDWTVRIIWFVWAVRAPSLASYHPFSTPLGDESIWIGFYTFYIPCFLIHVLIQQSGMYRASILP